MAYDTRYEPSADFIMNGILAWVQTYLSGGSAFTETTQPTVAQVEQMIDTRVEEVAAALVAAGYSSTQPVLTVGTGVTRLLSRAVILGVLIDIELTKQTRTVARGENTRWQAYQDRYDAIMAIITGSTLALMGATRVREASDGLEVTGQSYDEQNTLVEDTDVKGPLFPRGTWDQYQDRYTLVSDTPS